MILSLFVFSWLAQGIVRLRGHFVAGAVAQHFVRVRDVWTCKFSWQAQRMMRLRVAEVNVAVTLGLACERVFWRAGIAKLLGRAA